MFSILKKPVSIVLLVLFIDQALKIWVKTHMMVGEEFSVCGNWFIIHFIENNGMAFGMELAGKFGKIILSVFRIVAVVAIAYYLQQLSKKNAPYGLIISISLVLAGAIGNILDSAFYGLIFNDSYPHVATLFPAEGGYAPFLRGKVVDMFYFPVFKGIFPDWIPKWGGEPYVFFRPVFNIADSAITIGICIILIFHRKYFK